MRDLFLESLKAHYKYFEKFKRRVGKHIATEIEESHPELLFETGFYYGRADWVLTALCLDTELRPIMERSLNTIAENDISVYLREISLKHLADEVRWQWWRLNEVLEAGEDFRFPPYRELEFTQATCEGATVLANIHFTQFGAPTYAASDDQCTFYVPLLPVSVATLDPSSQFRFEYEVPFPEAVKQHPVVPEMLLRNEGDFIDRSL